MSLLFSIFSFFWPFYFCFTHTHVRRRLMTMGCGLVKERVEGEGRQMGTAARGGLLLLGCAGLEAVASKLERDTNHMALFIYRSHPGYTTPVYFASCFFFLELPLSTECHFPLQKSPIYNSVLLKYPTWHNKRYFSCSVIDFLVLKDTNPFLLIFDPCV